MAPFSGSPVKAPFSIQMTFDERRSIDNDYKFDNAYGGFDVDFSKNNEEKVIGRLPQTSPDYDADLHDKRSHPEDEDEDEYGGGKRQESEGKISKKPGRKLLISEPTNKRKAQNRAAQRAFRERKEKHLKDLETRVEDLRTASESANHENSILRAQMERMSMELQEYREIFSSLRGNRSLSGCNIFPSIEAGRQLGNTLMNNPSDVSFNFEFPGFGKLPEPSLGLAVTSMSTSPTTQLAPSAIGRDLSGSRGQSMPPTVTKVSSVSLTQTSAPLNHEISSRSILFSPLLVKGANSGTAFAHIGDNTTSNGSRSSMNSTGINSNGSISHKKSDSAPSVTSNFQNGGSCETCPEPVINISTPSKVIHPMLTAIGDEYFCVAMEGDLTSCDKFNMPCENADNPTPRTISNAEGVMGSVNPRASPYDSSKIDWLAQHNSNQFDPQLHEDYRESQHNILTGEGFAHNLPVHDFALPEFNMLYNAATGSSLNKVTVAHIKDNQNEKEDFLPTENSSQLLNCSSIWHALPVQALSHGALCKHVFRDSLQELPDIKAGEYDIDLLCKDMQKKARCSETGALVRETDFNDIMKSYVDAARNDTGKGTTQASVCE